MYRIIYDEERRRRGNPHSERHSIDFACFASAKGDRLRTSTSLWVSERPSPKLAVRVAKLQEISEHGSPRSIGGVKQRSTAVASRLFPA